MVRRPPFASYTSRQTHRPSHLAEGHVYEDACATAVVPQPDPANRLPCTIAPVRSSLKCYRADHGGFVIQAFSSLQFKKKTQAGSGSE